MEVFNGLVSEAGIYVPLPPGDYYAFHALSTVVSSAGGGSDTLTATLYSSDDDGQTWTSHASPISAASVATRALNSVGGGAAITGSSIGMQKLRLVTPTSSVQHVRLFVVPRFKKRNPLVLAVRAAQERAAAAAEHKQGCGSGGSCRDTPLHKLPGPLTGSGLPARAVHYALKAIDPLIGWVPHFIPSPGVIPGGVPLPPDNQRGDTPWGVFTCTNGPNAVPGNAACLLNAANGSCFDCIACMAEDRTIKLALCHCNTGGSGVAWQKCVQEVMNKTSLNQCFSPNQLSGQDCLAVQGNQSVAAGCQSAYTTCRKTDDVPTCQAKLHNCLGF